LLIFAILIRAQKDNKWEKKRQDYFHALGRKGGTSAQPIFRPLAGLKSIGWYFGLRNR